MVSYLYNYHTIILCQLKYILNFYGVFFKKAKQVSFPLKSGCDTYLRVIQGELQRNI